MMVDVVGLRSEVRVYKQDNYFARKLVFFQHSGVTFLVLVVQPTEAEAAWGNKCVLF